MNLKENIRRILKEEVEQYDQQILSFLKGTYQSDVKEFFDGHKFQTISFFIPYPNQEPENSDNSLNGEWYNITSSLSKKDMVNRILNMLNENDIIDLNGFNPNTLDKDRQKVVKTIRYFLDQVLIN